jgi:DNA phosphorothioation-dependent restriction protein DptG
MLELSEVKKGITWQEALMTKHIFDPQVKELIDRLKGLVVDWYNTYENFGEANDYDTCALELQQVIDNYLNQPGPSIEPIPLTDKELEEANK